MNNMLKQLLRYRWIESVILTMLRPVRKWFMFSWVWQRIKWAICSQSQGRDGDLRWTSISSESGLYVHPGELVGSIYFEPNSYEPITTRFIRNHLKYGQTFVDIGANYGYFTMLSAGIVGDVGTVLAFEANPSLRKIIKRSIDCNGFGGRVIVADVALSDCNEDNVTFFLTTDPHQMGISSMHPWEGHIVAGNLSHQNTINISTVCFDDWVKNVELNRIDMVKLDVEGAELKVLRGMRMALQRFNPPFIVVETSLTGEVSQYLGEFGYHAHSLELHDVDKKWGNILFSR